MEYFLVSVIAYLGLLAGYIILHLAQEEKKPGMKYFKFIENVLFFVSLIVLVYYNASLIALIAIIFWLLYRKYSIYIAYLSFAFGFFVLGGNLIYATIIFGYGLTAGSIIYQPRKNRLSRIIFLIYFIVIANILKLIL